MTLHDYLGGKISYQEYIDSAMAEVGTRTLAADRRVGPWKQYDPDADDLVDRYGEYWTVIDRDTGELIGSFGIEVQLPTREEALAEAERFGSKWGWPTDRVWIRDGRT